MRSGVGMVGGPVLTALRRGASVKAAAKEGQLAEQPLRSWIRRGRGSPDSQFGPFAAAFDGRRRGRPDRGGVRGRPWGQYGGNFSWS